MVDINSLYCMYYSVFAETEVKAVLLKILLVYIRQEKLTQGLPSSS